MPIRWKKKKLSRNLFSFEILNHLKVTWLLSDWRELNAWFNRSFASLVIAFRRMSNSSLIGHNNRFYYFINYAQYRAGNCVGVEIESWEFGNQIVEFFKDEKCNKERENENHFDQTFTKLPGFNSLQQNFADLNFFVFLTNDFVFLFSYRPILVIYLILSKRFHVIYQLVKVNSSWSDKSIVDYANAPEKKRAEWGKVFFFN
jgi:hypothetical protein